MKINFIQQFDGNRNSIFNFCWWCVINFYQCVLFYYLHLQDIVSNGARRCEIYANVSNDFIKKFSSKFDTICSERRPGSIDVHPNCDAIVLNYEIDVQILGPKENIIHGEKKVCFNSHMSIVYFFKILIFQSLKKIIELPMINSRTDCHSFSKEVINHCDLIHHSRLAEVEQIIYYLKKRKLQTNAKRK